MPITASPPTAGLFTDTIHAGWEAHLAHHQVSGLWYEDVSSLHINHLEHRAVQLALGALEEVLPQGMIRLRSDNSTVFA